MNSREALIRGGRVDGRRLKDVVLKRLEPRHRTENADVPRSVAPGGVEDRRPEFTEGIE